MHVKIWVELADATLRNPGPCGRRRRCQWPQRWQWRQLVRSPESDVSACIQHPSSDRYRIDYIGDAPHRIPESPGLLQPCQDGVYCLNSRTEGDLKMAIGVQMEFSG